MSMTKKIKKQKPLTQTDLKYLAWKEEQESANRLSKFKKKPD